tara:strand:- start:67 stop:2928 length:2862 start_codon:yes stop_codon:yes gene_type:complete
MKDIDLIDLVRPEGGWFGFLAVKNKTETRQLILATRKELDSKIQQYVADRWCVFFGLGKYKTGDSRTQSNVESLKSYWVDIDCGPGKSIADGQTGRPSGYETQALGIKALQSFCKTIGLPKPLLINSGNGVHAYWCLTQDVPTEEWTPVAKWFRQLCIDNDFYVDTKVFEAARVLRPLGTFNFKGDSDGVLEKEVKLLSASEPLEFSQFKESLGYVASSAPIPKPKRELTALGKAIRDNYTTKFSTIMVKSAEGRGCAQLLDCYQNREGLPEPRWFDALSVAKFCSDRDKAIHKLSEGHPAYDYHLVERKAEGIKGPHSCAEFEINNPGLCAGCPHQGKIKSPISIGNEVIHSEAEEVTVQSLDEELEVLKIPKYPQDYFRPPSGGIYFQPKPTGDQTPEPFLVYEHDLFVEKRLCDPTQGDVTIVKLRLPLDGIREFVLTNVQLSDKAELRKCLASHGAIVSEKKFVFLQNFLVLSVKGLQYLKRIENMRLQFGWADNDSKFIIGDREITSEGTYHSPPSGVTSEIAAHLKPTGSFEKWKEVFDLYGRPGLEPHAFAALTAFGAPLLKFLGQNGAIINVIHPDSGTGKTTILHMANSVYGDPQRLCSMWNDTLNAKIMRLGIMNNLPFTVDEMTNTTPADFSTLAYSMSQGRGKDRVKASANELRVNLTSWATISLASSNASFYEKMTSLKTSPEGELMRLLEYKIQQVDAIPTDIAKDMFDHQLKENYGHAGDIYIKYLVANLEKVITLARQIQAKLDKEMMLVQRERFWSVVIAANLAGGIIASKLGLHNWDMGRIYKWTPHMLKDLRDEVTAPAGNASAIIGDYINRHIAMNTLVVQDAVDRRTAKVKAPVLVPRGSLLIRYEPDTRLMFLAAKQFKDDCVDSQVNYRDTLAQLAASGVFKETTNKRLSKGMDVPSTNTHCIVLDCSNPEFIDMDAFVSAAADDDSRRH